MSKNINTLQQGQLRKYAQVTLASNNLQETVRLPLGEDVNEWLAMNTVDFYNQINMLYGCVTEFCTKDQCPTMSAGPRYEYQWQDGKKYRRPVKMSAEDYTDHLMTWVQSLIDDEAIFPSKIGAEFPADFQTVVKSIMRRLFRVYAHLYNHHFAQMCALKLEPHLNTSYRHFLLFVDEFGLVDRKEMVPLAELNEMIVSS